MLQGVGSEVFLPLLRPAIPMLELYVKSPRLGASFKEELNAKAPLCTNWTHFESSFKMVLLNLCGLAQGEYFPWLL